MLPPLESLLLYTCWNIPVLFVGPIPMLFTWAPPSTLVTALRLWVCLSARLLFVPCDGDMSYVSFSHRGVLSAQIPGSRLIPGVISSLSWASSNPHITSSSPILHFTHLVAFLLSFSLCCSFHLILPVF